MTEEQEKAQFVVKVVPATKATLEKFVAGSTARTSVTSLLEGAAAAWEKSTLARLKSDEHRKFYLRGVLTVEVAFGRSSKWKNRAKSTMAERTDTVSALMAAEAKNQLQRYAKFYGISLATVLDIFASNLEKGIKRRPPPPDPEPQQQPEEQNLETLATHPGLREFA